MPDETGGWAVAVIITAIIFGITELVNPLLKKWYAKDCSKKNKEKEETDEKMNNITKKPKAVDVYVRPVTNYEYTYSCPACKIAYVGYLQGNVTRFICSCGQELIVRNRIQVVDTWIPDKESEE
jgi:hypothetical protein